MIAVHVKALQIPQAVVDYILKERHSLDRYITPYVL